jgi:hypothetical protein
MKSASRTLVKSPPELWELLDQPDRMQGLMCGLIGRATEVTVEKREPECFLRWEASADDADAWIEVQLAEKGWGTNVKLKAENGDEPTKLEGWLDAVLEELATPQKRPFEGMDGGAPAKSPVEEAPAVEPEPEEPEPEEPEPEQPEEEPEVPERPAEPAAPAAESPPAGDPEPERPGMFRRILGI